MLLVKAYFSSRLICTDSVRFDSIIKKKVTIVFKFTLNEGKENQHQIRNQHTEILFFSIPFVLNVATTVVIGIFINKLNIPVLSLRKDITASCLCPLRYLPTFLTKLCLKGIMAVNLHFIYQNRSATSFQMCWNFSAAPLCIAAQCECYQYISYLLKKVKILFSFHCL